jgi:hypothetical protein
MPPREMGGRVNAGFNGVGSWFCWGVTWTLERGTSEWCLDAWHESYRGAPDDGRAWVSEGSHETSRLRGGSWFNLPGNGRSAYRYRLQPDDAYDNIGFRVVCLPQGPSPHP